MVPTLFCVSFAVLGVLESPRFYLQVIYDNPRDDSCPCSPEPGPEEGGQCLGPWFSTQ